MPAWPLALAALPLGFLVAEATGVRPIGGAVLAALALAAVLAARPRAARAAAWLAVLLACFAASHSAAGELGAWGAVALVTALTGAAGWLLLDRPRRSDELASAGQPAS